MRFMSFIRASAVFIAAALFALAAAAQLSGGYFGIGAAEGMRLTIEPGGSGARGALTGSDGVRRPFEASRVDDGFEAMLEGPEGRTLIRVLPAAAGARVVLAPVDEAGVMDAGRMAALAFLRDGTELPRQPTRFLPAPTRPVQAFDARSFVDSYPYWEAQGAALAYDAVAPRYRAVIRMFPLVQADILFRLCALNPRPPAVAEALRGQGVTCDSVMSARSRLTSGGGSARFVDAVEAERVILLQALGCADDLLRRKPECARLSDEIARRAVSMETVGTALARYR
jgi:hypothetical protein